jgi:thymidylate kinase
MNHPTAIGSSSTGCICARRARPANDIRRVAARIHDMKQRVLFAGIDGSGKSSSLDWLISNLQKEYRIIKVVNGDGSLVVDGEKQLVFKRFYRLVEWVRPRAKKYHFYSYFLALKYLYKFVVIKYVERFGKCDLLMFEIDFLLHPAVYVTYHFPWTGRISSKGRLRIFTGLFGSKGKSTIMHLDIEPAEAVRRIHERGEEVQPHENVDDLTKLHAEFDRVVAAARSIGFYIHTISARLSQAEVVAEAEQVLRERLLDCRPQP